MEWSRLPWFPSREMLRQFSVLWLLFVAAPAAWKAQVDGWATPVALLTGLVGVLGLRWPETVRPLWVALLAASFPVGWAMSQVVMFSLFYGLLTPIGLLLRWSGHDPLRLRASERDQPTYWKQRPTDSPHAHYLKTYRSFS